MESKINTKEIVESILKDYPQTRDDDFLLCLHVLVRMGYARKNAKSVVIYYKNLEEAPAFETITRIRREIQNNEGRLLASEKVERKRERHRKKITNKYSDYTTKYTRADTFPGSWMSA